jgi:hypothetical protein
MTVDATAPGASLDLSPSLPSIEGSKSSRQQWRFWIVRRVQGFTVKTKSNTWNNSVTFRATWNIRTFVLPKLRIAPRAIIRYNSRQFACKFLIMPPTRQQHVGPVTAHSDMSHRARSRPARFLNQLARGVRPRHRSCFQALQLNSHWPIQKREKGVEERTLKKREEKSNPTRAAGPGGPALACRDLVYRRPIPLPQIDEFRFPDLPPPRGRQTTNQQQWVVCPVISHLPRPRVTHPELRGPRLKAQANPPQPERPGPFWVYKCVC